MSATPKSNKPAPKKTITVTKTTKSPKLPTTTQATSTQAQSAVNGTYTGTGVFLQNTGGPVQLTTQTVAPTGTADYTQGNAFINIPGIWSGQIWLTSFQTGSYTSFEQDQVHRGMSWFPIRRNEMFLQFTIDWPYQSMQNPDKQGFNTMQAFQDALRLHQQESALTTGIPTPVSLIYYNGTGTGGSTSSIVRNNLAIRGNNLNLLKQSAVLTSGTAPTETTNTLQPLTYQGWVETVEKEYVRFRSVFRRTYRMNIINQTSTSVQGSQLLTSSTYNSLVPNSMSAQQYGSGWTSANINGNTSGIIALNQIIG